MVKNLTKEVKEACDEILNHAEQIKMIGREEKIVDTILAEYKLITYTIKFRRSC